MATKIGLLPLYLKLYDDQDDGHVEEEGVTSSRGR